VSIDEDFRKGVELFGEEGRESRSKESPVGVVVDQGEFVLHTRIEEINVLSGRYQYAEGRTWAYSVLAVTVDHLMRHFGNCDLSSHLIA
jgi:hypothetical protein